MNEPKKLYQRMQEQFLTENVQELKGQTEQEIRANRPFYIKSAVARHFGEGSKSTKTKKYKSLFKLPK